MESLLKLLEVGHGGGFTPHQRACLVLKDPGGSHGTSRGRVRGEQETKEDLKVHQVKLQALPFLSRDLEQTPELPASQFLHL